MRSKLNCQFITRLEINVKFVKERQKTFIKFHQVSHLINDDPNTFKIS